MHARRIATPSHGPTTSESGAARRSRQSRVRPRPSTLADERGRGLGSALVASLREEAERAGFHKIVRRVFADNESSRRLVAKHGFREVGTHLRHGRPDGEWHDVPVVELLLGEAAAG